MSVKRARSRGSAMTAKNVRSWDFVKYRGRRWSNVGIEAEGVILRPPTTSSRLHVLAKACSDAPGCRGWPGSRRFERLGALPRQLSGGSRTQWRGRKGGRLVAEHERGNTRLQAFDKPCSRERQPEG